MLTAKALVFPSLSLERWFEALEVCLCGKKVEVVGWRGKLSLNCMVHAHVMLRSSPDDEVFR